VQETFIDNTHYKGKCSFESVPTESLESYFPSNE
jgi:hypothetical protein